MIFIAAGIIFIISFLLAFWSLRQELQKSRHTKHVEHELAKEKVLFYNPPSHTEKE